MITIPQYFYNSTIITFDLFIALDRMLAVFFPQRFQKSWARETTAHRLLVALGFGVGFTMALLVAIADYDKALIGYCSSRLSMAVLLQQLFVPYLLWVACITVGIYVFCLMFAKTCVSQK